MFLPETVQKMRSCELASLLLAFVGGAARFLKIVDQALHHTVECFAGFVTKIFLKRIVFGTEKLSLLSLLLPLSNMLLLAEFVPPVRWRAARCLRSFQVVDEVRLRAIRVEVFALPFPRRESDVSPLFNELWGVL